MLDPGGPNDSPCLGWVLTPHPEPCWHRSRLQHSITNVALPVCDPRMCSLYWHPLSQAPMPRRPYEWRHLTGRRDIKTDSTVLRP